MGTESAAETFKGDVCMFERADIDVLLKQKTFVYILFTSADFSGTKS